MTIVFRVTSATVASLMTTFAFAQGTALQRAACTPDVFRLCSGEIPNVDRITACLRREKAKLSTGCQNVVGGIEEKKVATRSIGEVGIGDEAWCAFGENPAPQQELWIAWCAQASRTP